MATFNGIKILRSAITDANSVGYAIPSIPPLSDVKYETINNSFYDVSKSSVTDPDDLTLFTNIINELTTFFTTELDNFDDVTFTITAYAELYSITVDTGDKFDESSESYRCEYKMFIEVS